MYGEVILSAQGGRTIQSGGYKDRVKRRPEIARVQWLTVYTGQQIMAKCHETDSDQEGGE